YWDQGTVQTAAAISRDGKTLILAVTDTALRPQELAQTLADQGGYTAIKFDGGGSSALYFDGNVLKSGRPVAEALLIVPRFPRLTLSSSSLTRGGTVGVSGAGFTPNRRAMSHLR